jgi:hypothetical protein
MPIDTSTAMHDLAKSVCGASEAHVGLFLEELNDGLVVGEELYSDIEGRPGDYGSADPVVRDRIQSAQMTGGDVVRLRTPGSPSTRRYSAATNLS